MSLSTDRAIFSRAIAGNPFYSGRGGNWWVLKAKFPRRAGTYCENHSYWNVSNRLSIGGGRIWEQYCAHSKEQMRSKVERGSRFKPRWICLNQAGDFIRLPHVQRTTMKRLKVWMLWFGLYLPKIDSLTPFFLAHVIYFIPEHPQCEATGTPGLYSLMSMLENTHLPHTYWH